MDSIFSQTVTDWELVVCDSYSDDGTWEFLQQFRSDPRIHLYQIPKEGLYAGWNQCLNRARGEFIYIATADDTMEPSCLEQLMAPMVVCPEAGLTLANVRQINEQGHTMEVPQKEIQRFFHRHSCGCWTRWSREAMFLALACFGWGLGSVTGFLFRRSLLSQTGFFPTDLSFLGDAEWTLRAVLAADVVCIDDSLATWRCHPSQASRRADILKEACYFREALRRVLDDPQSPIPPAWTKIPAWREILLTPRTIELEMATKLVRSNLSRYWSKFPLWIWEAWQRCPKLLCKRILGAFGHPSSWNRTATERVEEWLHLFPVPWPPSALEPTPGSPTSANLVPAN